MLETLKNQAKEIDKEKGAKVAERLRISISSIHHGSSDADPIGQVPVYKDGENVHDGADASSTAASLKAVNMNIRCR